MAGYFSSSKRRERLIDRTRLKGLLEAMLLLANRPLTIEGIMKVLQDEKKDAAKEAIRELVSEYSSSQRGFYIEEVAGGYQFRTRECYTPWLKRLEGLRPPRLTQPALETLAVIAYKQPVLRAEIEEVRGVDVGGVLKTLLEKRLIKILGRKDVPGRPLVYGTTKEFLELFGLKDISSLPTLKDSSVEICG